MATQQRIRRGQSDEKLGRSGGVSGLTRAGSQGATVRGKFVSLSPILPSLFYLSIDVELFLTVLALYLDFIFFFPGVKLATGG